ncbi:MAG TPA: L,D-transpeptidase [Patescibacteria group bacterium]|nr:L,D-transpeptidase [Patescibacteria group bacterium]
MAKKKKAKKRGFFIVRKNGFLLVLTCVVLFFGLGYFLNLTPFNKPFCANSISCIKDLSGNYEPNQEAIFNGQKVDEPQYIASIPQKTQVLGETSEKKHIYVDLTNQKLYAYQGGDLVYEFPVATGKWHPTPTGDFKIWIKLLYTRMSGGSGADYYDLPNVPYTMFFYNDKVPKGDGFSIHGAYWHNNFGYPMSHGCVNMRPEDAEKIYNWADPATQGNTTYATAENPGTTVTIYGESPN